MTKAKVKDGDKNIIVDPKKEFMRCFKELTGARHQYPVWSDIWELFALTIMNPLTKDLYSEHEYLKKVWDEREERYKTVISRYSEEEVNTIISMFGYMVLEFDNNPYQDFAGQTYMELGISNKNSGQFFTPYNLTQLMARLTMSHESLRRDVKERGWCMIYDCAVGGGATLIGGCEKASQEFKRLDWRNHVMCMGNDIDITCVHMCYVQLSLLGVAGIVTQSDALTTAQVDFYKTPECVWFTPTYFNKLWTERRFWHGYDMMMRVNPDAPMRKLFGGK